MARLRTKYRDSVTADVPVALEAEAVMDHPSAAASAPHDDSGVAASRLKEQLDEPEDDLGKNGLPPLACHWLRANPDYLHDADKNQRLQDLHWVLVQEGYEGYSPEYFAEVDKRLHAPNSGDDEDDELSAAAARLEAAERDRDRIAEWNTEFDGAFEESQKSPVDRVLDEIRAARKNNTSVDAKPRRTIPPVSAPPSREAPTSNGARSNSRVTLSPQQREAARLSGVDEVTYAKGILRLQAEKEAGNYTGKP
jgi:hypothetical protein